MLRYVTGGKEGVKVRSHDYVEWPPTVSSHGLANSHIRSIQVWPFFPIYLDAYKRGIKQISNLGITEAFLLHNMTPMATCIAYAEKDGFVLGFGFIDGFLSPRVPIYRIISVLKKVRAFFID